MEQKGRYSLVMENQKKKAYFEKKGIPYTECMDMVVAIRIILKENYDELKWEYVTNDDLGKINFNFNELYKLAFKSDEEHGYVVREVTDLIANNPLLRRKTTKKYEKIPPQQRVYILSNKENLHGATVLLHKEFLKGVSKTLGCKLILAPVSEDQVWCITENASPYLKINLKNSLFSGRSKLSEEEIIF